MIEVAILGLGRFGMNLAIHLADQGVRVLAVDRRKELVAEVVDNPQIDTAILDITDEELLRNLDLRKMTACVVAIGENFEAAILATYHLREIARETRMKLFARAQTPMQAEILRRIGADEVLQPESEFARLLTRRVSNPQVEDFIELDGEHVLIKLQAPSEFHGRMLGDLQLTKRYRVNLVCIRRPLAEKKRFHLIAVPSEQDTIEAGDVLVLLGDNDALTNIPRD